MGNPANAVAPVPAVVTASRPPPTAARAPAGDPRWAVVVMVEQGGHGGEAAAPIARRIYEQLFGIGPTQVRPGTDSSG